MKLGILGGTFNPIHLGHLVLAQECWDQLELDKVLFIPAFTPPHKNIGDDISAADRLNMVRLALEGDERFEISTYEIDKKGTSYSIETIKHLRKKYGEDIELFFLTGADSARGMSTWKNVDEILDLTTFVIATRPGWEGESPYEGRVRRVVIPHIDVSSSMVRERIKNRQAIDHIVPVRAVKY
ncbi:MAG: nicotinate-nucleotide adenylyltransferase, partial [Candidatus Omnitrophica bacterium]|nr:nicotinate-nucleotide adenylyltransferase [Candidatus Omnitrophota bacterium]